jgi:hypothetical protein
MLTAAADDSAFGTAFVGLLLCFAVVFLLGIPLVRMLRGPKSRRPRLYGERRRPGGRS